MAGEKQGIGTRVAVFIYFTNLRDQFRHDKAILYKVKGHKQILPEQATPAISKHMDVKTFIIKAHHPLT